MYKRTRNKEKYQEKREKIDGLNLDGNRSKKIKLQIRKSYFALHFFPKNKLNNNK